jgi:hypothetical protein
MHIVAKGTIGAGALVLLIGIAMLVLAGSEFGDAASGWEAEESTGATFYVLDEDRKGDIGFAFFVEGEYTDDDGDGVWDHCRGVEITVTQKPDVNTEWSEEDGDFFFQASEDKGKSCDVEEGKDLNRPGFAKIGMACVGCHAGDFEFESNQPVWVVYVDEALGDFFASLGAGIGGGSCLCCGIVIMLFGLILALVVKDDEQPATTITYGEDGKVIVQQPGAEQQPPQTGISQSATGEAAEEEVPTTVVLDEEEGGLHSSFGGGFG